MHDPQLVKPHTDDRTRSLPLCLCDHISPDHEHEDGCQAVVNGKPCGCPHFMDSGQMKTVDAVTYRRSLAMPGYMTRLDEWLS